jgi:hypothetical protein
MDKIEKLKTELKRYLPIPINGDTNELKIKIENEMTVNELEKCIGFMESLNNSGFDHFIINIIVSKDGINISTRCGINIVREKV